MNSVRYQRLSLCSLCFMYATHECLFATNKNTRLIRLGNLIKGSIDSIKCTNVNIKMRLFEGGCFGDNFKCLTSAQCHVILNILYLNHHNYKFYDICISKLCLLFMNDFHAAKLNKNWAIHRRAKGIFHYYEIYSTERWKKFAQTVSLSRYTVCIFLCTEKSPEKNTFLSPVLRFLSFSRSFLGAEVDWNLRTIDQSYTFHQHLGGIYISVSVYRSFFIIYFIFSFMLPILKTFSYVHKKIEFLFFCTACFLFYDSVQNHERVCEWVLDVKEVFMNCRMRNSFERRNFYHIYVQVYVWKEKAATVCSFI